MQKAFINCISYFLPEKEFTNADFFELFPDSSSSTSLRQIGVESRRIVGEGVTASDMAVNAAEKLFVEHQLDRSTVDFVLFCAQEFDYYTPTTACVIQDRLGLSKKCGAMDFNLGCSGFVYGLSVAKGLIETGAANNVLLLTSSTLTRKFHEKDASSRFIFGDGAAATLISSRENEGIGQFEFGTDGSSYEKIIVKDGAGRNPKTEDSSNEIEDQFGNVTSPGTFYMDGIGIFLFSNRVVPKLVSQTLELNKVELEEVDLFVFHQANAYLLETLRKKIDIPEEKFVVSMSHTGNTVASTIPIAFKNALEAGRVKRGDKVMVVAFGVGLSWGGTLITF